MILRDITPKEYCLNDHSGGSNNYTGSSFTLLVREIYLEINKSTPVLRTRISDLSAQTKILFDLVFRTKSIKRNNTAKIILSEALRRFTGIKIQYSSILEYRQMKFVVENGEGLSPISVRAFEPCVYSFISHLKGNLFIEIGANVGGYVLNFWNNFNQVVAVEPGSTSSDFLKANIRINNIKNTKVVRKAISKNEGSAVFYKSKDSVNWSLKGEGSGEMVETITLARLLQEYESVDLLLIDVEGSELDVIESGGASIEKVKQMIIEVRESFENEICSILNTHGFKKYDLEIRKEIKEKNILFVNDNI